MSLKFYSARKVLPSWQLLRSYQYHPGGAGSQQIIRGTALEPLGLYFILDHVPGSTWYWEWEPRVAVHLPSSMSAKFPEQFSALIYPEGGQ